MAKTYPTPEQISTAAADALGGTTHTQTAIPFIADGTDESSTPTVFQQLMRNEQMVRRVLARGCKLMAVKTDTLEIAVFPSEYREADDDDAVFEDGATGVALTADETNYVYLDIASNTILVDITGWPADKSTFIPIAKYVCTSDIVTSDEDADQLHLALLWTRTAAAAISGTSATSFLLDNDNAGAEATQQIQFERGATDPENAAIEYDATNDRFNFRLQHSTSTLAPVNAAAVMVAGSDVIDSSGDLAAAAIKATTLYTFGANGATPYGVLLTPSGSSGAPSSGTHAAGELAVDTNGKVYICVTAGTPGTWQTIGKQDDTIVWSVGNASASAAAAASVTIQAQDQFGTNIAAARLVRVLLMDDVDGAAYAANVTTVAATTGSLVRTITANKEYVAKTDASGTLVLEVTNSIADSVYVLVDLAPGGYPADCRDTGTLTYT